MRLLRRVLLELARGDEGAPRQHEGALLQGGRGGDEEEGGANGKKVVANVASGISGDDMLTKSVPLFPPPPSFE